MADPGVPGFKGKSFALGFAALFLIGTMYFSNRVITCEKERQLQPLTILRSHTQELRENVPEENQDSEILRTQKLRKERIHNACAGFHPTERESMSYMSRAFSHIVVDDKYKALYCFVPKAGCSTWKSFLVKIHSGIKNFKIVGSIHRAGLLNEHGLRILSTYNAQEAAFRLSTYFKFMFVRHPLTRVVSAFRDKFLKFNGFYAYAGDIIRYSRNISDPIPQHKVDDYNITFTEFLNFTFSKNTPAYAFKTNEHWIDIHKLCSPCTIDYDFIGKQETFDEDADYLKEVVYKNGSREMKRRNWTGTKNKVALDFMRPVPPDLKAVLIEHYRLDAQMFGYNIDEYYKT